MAEYAATAAASATRPQIYVHFEFGVSWTSKHAPRNHGITYLSRSMREPRHAQPKQLPPANTNYLSHIAEFYQYGQLPRHAHTVNHGQNHARQHPYDYQQAYQHQPHPQQLQLQYPQQGTAVVEVTRDARRHSRRDSRSSHERGRSAPPPFNDSPWNATPEPVGASALPHRRYDDDGGGHLPAGSPSRFRLGGSGMPWSADTWPLGGSNSSMFGSDAGDRSSSDRRHGRRHQGSDDDEVDQDRAPFANRPTTVALTPGGAGSADRDRSEDPARVHDLGALSAAMMTVDNGFENQWWNQGQRETTVTIGTVAGRLPTPPESSSRSLGWALRRDTNNDDNGNTTTVAAAALVPDADARIRSRQVQHDQDQLDRRVRHHPLHQRTPSGSAVPAPPGRSGTIPVPVSALSPHQTPSSATASAADLVRLRGTMVSPVSEYGAMDDDRVGRGHRASRASSVPSFDDRLHRSLTVRSDELWLEEKGSDD